MRQSARDLPREIPGAADRVTVCRATILARQTGRRTSARASWRGISAGAMPSICRLGGIQAGKNGIGGLRLPPSLSRVPPFGRNDGMAMSTSALCARLGVRPRTLRSWIDAGVVPRPPYRGRATVHGQEGVLRACAAAALRRESVPLALVKIELDRASPERLRELAGVPAEAASAPSDPAPEPGGQADPPEPLRAAAIAGEPRPGRRWQRIELVDGLELHLADDAGPIPRRIAGEITAARWR